MAMELEAVTKEGKQEIFHLLEGPTLSLRGKNESMRKMLQKLIQASR